MYYKKSLQLKQAETNKELKQYADALRNGKYNIIPCGQDFGFEFVGNKFKPTQLKSLNELFCKAAGCEVYNTGVYAFPTNGGANRIVAHCHKSTATSICAKVFEEALVYDDFGFEENDEFLTLEFSGWEYVLALDTDKHQLLNEIALIIKSVLNIEVVGDSADQLTPNYPIVSMLFVKK